MSTISNLIFNGASHTVSSPYGKRNVIKTSAGNTSSFHSGTDYSTGNKKIAQYAVADGYVFTAAKASDGALYVWVIYPTYKLAMLHYHLDSYKVKAGQKVTKGTLLGYTGMTGKATGIHLHLGIKPLNSLTENVIKSMTWSSLNKCSYTDPEKVVFKEVATTTTKKTTTTTKKYATGNYKVSTDCLNVRTGAGKNYSIKSFNQLSTNAQSQIKEIAGKKVNGLVRGCVVTVSEVKNEWGKTPSGWICLDYCTKLK